MSWQRKDDTVPRKEILRVLHAVEFEVASAKEAANAAMERASMAEKELREMKEALLCCVPPDTIAVSDDEEKPRELETVPASSLLDSKSDSYSYQLPLSLVPPDTPSS